MVSKDYQNSDIVIRLSDANVLYGTDITAIGIANCHHLWPYCDTCADNFRTSDQNSDIALRFSDLRIIWRSDDVSVFFRCTNQKSAIFLLLVCLT